MRSPKARLGRPRNAAVFALAIDISTVLTPLQSGRSRNSRCPASSTMAIVGCRLISAPLALQAATSRWTSSVVRQVFLRIEPPCGSMGNVIEEPQGSPHRFYSRDQSVVFIAKVAAGQDDENGVPARSIE